MSALNKSTGFPLDSLEFLLCPNEEALEQTLRNSHPGWGITFPLETWIANNKWLVHNTQYANSRRHKLWIVTSREDPLRTVLCSGGYFERKALLAYKRERGVRVAQGMVEKSEEAVKNAETVVMETNTAHVALVCTAEQHRGHGYAGWMMRQIWNFFEQQPEFPFTYLYSAAGDMYVRMGWERFPADTLEIPAKHPLFPLDTSNPLLSASPSSSYEMTPIADDNLDEVMQWDAGLIRQELAQRIDQAHVGTTLVALLPDSPCILWHRARSQFYLKEDHRRRGDHSSIQPRLGDFGFSLNITATTTATTTTATTTTTTTQVADKSSNRKLGYVLWSHDFRNKQLILFRLRYGVPATAAREEDEGEGSHGKDGGSLSQQQVAMMLLDKAVQEARQWGLPKVTIWSPSPQVVEWLGLESHVRTQYLPCLGFCPHPDTSKYERPPTNKVEWILNELYAY